MKIIYVNCGWNMSEIWSWQCAFNLSSWKSNLKKFRLERDSNPWPCDTGAMLYPLSYQATWIDGQLWVRDIPDDSEIYEYEYMKIIYVNCGWNMSEIWSSQCAFNLSSWKSNLKKIQAWTRFEPMTLRYRCNALSTELPSHMDRWSIVSSWYTRW